MQFSFFRIVNSASKYSCYKTINVRPMNPYVHNNQDYLAEKCMILEYHVTHASKIALLKIQSWKFAMKTPEVGAKYQKAAEDMVRQSLLRYVPNSHILNEEGFYFRPMAN
jgi:hypothetical protein